MKEYMNVAHSINKDWLNQFFKYGGFLRKPSGELYLWLGPFKENQEITSSYKDIKGKSFVASIYSQNFFSEKRKLRTATEFVQKLEVSELQKLLFENFPLEQGRVKLKDFAFAQKSKFEESFRSIQGKILRQEIDKAVPVSFRKTEAIPSFDDRINWFKNLLNSNNQLYAYGMWDSDEGIMGATPEILFEREENIIQTMALAGTLYRGHNVKPEELLKSHKDIHEHQVVVEDIEKQLQKIGFIRKYPIEVIELPTLFHLRTRFQAEVGNYTDEELIKILHPTPALGVSPRAFGYHWLATLPEQDERFYHGAPLLFKYGISQSSCLVAIRNIQWNKAGTRIGAGCGIVQESDFESEWLEIQNKIESVIKLLGMK